MLIDDENIRVQYDSTAESPIMTGDPLPLPFKFVEKTQVRAILSDGTELILNQDYTVGYPEEEEPDEDESLVMTDNMVVILNIDIPVGETITIYRETALDQTSEFPQEARFSSRKIEDALDKLTMQNQEQRESLARALKLPLNAPIDIGNLALPNPEPNRSVKWNSEGTALINTSFDPDTALVTTENYKNQAVTAATGAAKSEAEAVKQATDAKNAAKSAQEDAQEVLDKSDALLNMSRVLPMFTPIWSDHTLNDASFLRADTFSWHSGKIFTAGYNTLVAEYNSKDCVTETEAGVTYKRTPSGFKIAAANQHDTVLNAFTSTGKSWFYVLDTAQQRFKLPRTKYSFTGIRDTVGGGVDAGLPSLSSNSTGAHTHTRGTMDITGQTLLFPCNDQGSPNAFYGATSRGGNVYGATDNRGVSTGMSFQASRNWTGATSSNGAHTHTITDSAGVLGKANTVQPPATQMYLYFFVGNYVRPTADIDVGKLVEYINDIDFVGETEDAVNTINTTAENNLKNINTTTTNSLNSITSTTTSGVNNLNSTKNACITEINNTGVSNRVLKTGDTMTGDLYMVKSNTATFHAKSTEYDWTATTAPSANLLVGRYVFRDKANNYTGGIENTFYTSGNLETQVITQRRIGETNKASRIKVRVDSSGVDRFEFPRCTTKATTTSSAANDKVAVVVQNYVNGTTWYRVWSDGWKEQGGANITGSSTGTLTFLKAFSNTNYTIVTGVRPNDSEGTIGKMLHFQKTKYADKIAWTCNGWSGSYVGSILDWYACGY